MERRTKLSVPIRVRVEPEFYNALKEISEATGWNMSEVVRYMLKVSYAILRPDVRIPVYKIIAFLASESVKEIERIEERSSEQRRT